MVSPGHTRNPLILGVDLGTSSLKALVVDARGAIVASAMRAYPLHRPRPHHPAAHRFAAHASLPTPRSPDACSRHDIYPSGLPLCRAK
ncbi:MAG: hypothetical protein ACXWQ5_24810 [Ktedonobacterales bacterium]